jgi:flagellin FlaB
MKTLNDQNRGQVGIGTLIVFIAMVLVAAIAAGVLINTAGFLQTQAQDTGEESTEQVADNLNVITQVGEVGGGTEDTIRELRVGVQPAAGANDINLAELTVQYVSDDDFANLVVGHSTVDLASEGAITTEGGTTPSEVSVIHPSDEADADLDTGDGRLDSISSISTTTQAGGDADPNNLVIVPNENNYLIEVITAENEDDIVMTDSSDRYELVIPLNQDASVYEGDFTSGGSDQFAAGEEQPGLTTLAEGEELELTITTEVGSQTVAFLQVPDSLSAPNEGATVSL